MATPTEKALEQRTAELERSSWTNKTEAQALKLPVGGSLTVKLFDFECLNRLRIRFYNMKSNYGKVFSTVLNGNDITITRLEDEVTQ
jgi:hypothetical protein